MSIIFLPSNLGINSGTPDSFTSSITLCISLAPMSGCVDSLPLKFTTSLTLCPLPKNSFVLFTLTIKSCSLIFGVILSSFKIEAALQLIPSVETIIATNAALKDKLATNPVPIDFKETGLKGFQEVAFTTAYAYLIY